MGRATRWLKGLFGLKTKEASNSGDRHDVGKQGQDSARLCHNPTTIPPNISPAQAAWLRSCYNETEKEQNKHAIAVAAATAAAADAAVAAVHAAVAVVRLKSHGRGTIFGGGREQWAAVRIQTLFRGYLARKALRALKGLVKLQAHVRGYLVRKQATSTLRSMQALIRAQTTVLLQRVCSQNEKFMERSANARTKHKVSIHSRRLWGSFDNVMSNFDENPKIVEVDTGRPKPRYRRTKTSVLDFSDNPPYQTFSSPVSIRDPVRLAIPDSRYLQDTDGGLTADECRFSTAHSTPRLANSVGSNALVTPSKSVCADKCRQSVNSPNYMANTQSSKAKLRSHSAPKQRPDPVGPKKQVSLNEMMEFRSRLSGVKMQRSCEQVSIKNAVMGKLNRLSELCRESEKNWGQRR
ncbi:hypothetical protein SLA2020_342120 [Shorea laevis]